MTTAEGPGETQEREGSKERGGKSEVDSNFVAFFDAGLGASNSDGTLNQEA
jgi:hypothetical protein